MNDSQSDKSGNKTDDDFDMGDDETGATDDTMNQQVDKQYVVEKIEIFRMIHENKCDDGK